MVVFCRVCQTQASQSQRYHPGRGFQRMMPCYVCPKGCKGFCVAPGELPGAVAARPTDLFFVDMEAANHPTTHADVILVRALRLRCRDAGEDAYTACAKQLEDVLGSAEFGGEVLMEQKGTQKAWMFPPEAYAPLVRALSGVNRICAEPVPQNVMQHREALARRGERGGGVPGGERFDHEDPMYAPLKEFQKRGVSFIVSNGGRGIIADEMGLGKTIQACTIAHHYRDEWPTLVMCPSSLAQNWAREFSQWCSVPESRITICGASLTNGKKGLLTPADIEGCAAVICGYNNLEKHLKGLQFKVVLCDESHFMKNDKAKRTIVAQAMISKCARLVLLSGTPTMSRPAELYTQLKLVKPDLIPNRTAFARRYCQGYYSFFSGGRVVDALGASHVRELNYLLRSVMVRRVKAEVLDELPDKAREVVFLQISEKDRKMLHAGVEELRRTVSSVMSHGGGGGGSGGGSGSGGGGLSSAEADDVDGMLFSDSGAASGSGGGLRAGSVLNLKVQTAKAKLAETRSYLKDFMESVGITGDGCAQEGEEPSLDCAQEDQLAAGEGVPAATSPAAAAPFKFIIFAHHREMLDGIEETISTTIVKGRDGRNRFLRYIRIDGAVKMSDRDTLVKNFREDGEVRVAILSIDSCSTGHNLTCASTVIFAELAWNPSSHLQAEDRVHRIGQRSRCNIIYLLAANTADDALWPLLQTKLAVTSQLLATDVLGDRDIALVPGAEGAPREQLLHHGAAAKADSQGGSAVAPLQAPAAPRQVTLDALFASKPRSHSNPFEGLKHGAATTSNNTSTSTSTSTSSHARQPEQQVRRLEPCVHIHVDGSDASANSSVVEVSPQRPDTSPVVAPTAVNVEAGRGGGRGGGVVNVAPPLVSRAASSGEGAAPRPRVLFTVKAPPVVTAGKATLFIPPAATTTATVPEAAPQREAGAPPVPPEGEEEEEGADRSPRPQRATKVEGGVAAAATVQPHLPGQPRRTLWHPK